MAGVSSILQVLVLVLPLTTLHFAPSHVTCELSIRQYCARTVSNYIDVEQRFGLLVLTLHGFIISLHFMVYSIYIPYFRK